MKGKRFFLRSHAAGVTAAAAGLAVVFIVGGIAAQSVDPNQDRIDAVNETIASNAVCSNLKDFYWEIGNKDGVLGSGAHGSIKGNQSAITNFKAKPMEIASSSKWLFSAYVVEKLNGSLDAVNDVRSLNFSSPFTAFELGDSCKAATWTKPAETIQACNDRLNNISATKAADKGTAYGFFYAPGHMEWRADNRNTDAAGLGLDGSAVQLGQQIGQVLGLSSLTYVNVGLAGGGSLAPNDYSLFLRKLLGHELKLGAMLGEYSVCTLEDHNRYGLKCKYSTDIPAESTIWSEYINPRYALGHWVEDDRPLYGDGAFSSPGVYGFYPWIEKNQENYGMIAIQQTLLQQYSTEKKTGGTSVTCGRMIRQAWETGAVQNSSSYLAEPAKTCTAFSQDNCPSVIPQ